MVKTICKVTIAMVIAVFPALSLNAQPQGEGKPEFKGKHRPMPTVDEIAQQRADVMNQELTLSEKQYKKILKYFKAQVEKEREIMQAGRPDGVPKGFPGGKRPDFGGGRPPMGGPGHQSGGFGGPQGGFPGGDPRVESGRPPMRNPEMGISDEEMEKYYEQQDKKLKKILTAEQYEKWWVKHPAQQLPMPEPEFK